MSRIKFHTYTQVKVSPVILSEKGSSRRGGEDFIGYIRGLKRNPRYINYSSSIRRHNSPLFTLRVGITFFFLLILSLTFLPTYIDIHHGSRHRVSSQMKSNGIADKTAEFL